MAADINSNLANWSTTAGSNQPDASDSIANLDDNLQQIQAVVRKYLATKGANIASGATVDLATATGNYVHVTGTTTITALGTVSSGLRYLIVFDGALTLTHHATSLILPSAQNIVTAAGDRAEFVSLGSGNWRCIWFTPAAGYQITNTFPINIKNYGAVGDGVTDDTTPYTNALTYCVDNDKAFLIPPGSYLVSGEVYVVTKDFIWINDNYPTTLNAIEAAEQKSIQLTSATPDTTPTDAADSRTSLGIVMRANGSQHANCARMDLYSYSDNAQGCTALYTSAVTNNTSIWAASLHAETKHAGGTTIGINSENASYADTGTFIGLNVQNTTNDASATHPITTGDATEFVESKAIQINGTTPEKGQWKYGLYINDASIKPGTTTGSASIRIDSDADYGIYTATGCTNTTADILLQGNSGHGIICNGTYGVSAIRIASGQAIGWDTNDTILSKYNSSTTAIELYSTTDLRFSFELDSTPVLKLNGTQVLQERITGWTAATGTADRGTFATNTILVEELAQRVKALIDDLTTHGLIGT